MLDHVLEDLLKVEKAGGDVEALRRSLAPVQTLAKDAAIVTRAAHEGGTSAMLFQFAQAQVRCGTVRCDIVRYGTLLYDPFRQDTQGHGMGCVGTVQYGTV